MFSLGGGIRMTHLSPDEQRVKYRAEQEEEKQGSTDEQGEEEDDEEDEPSAFDLSPLASLLSCSSADARDSPLHWSHRTGPRFYAVLSDPSNPNCAGILSSPAGGILSTHLSPEEQHAEWLKEQEEKRVGQDKAGQAAQAGGAGEDSA